jgi:hypothetical protein
MDSRAAEETVLLIRDYLCDIKPVSPHRKQAFLLSKESWKERRRIFCIGTWVIEEIFRYHWRLFED